MKPNVDRKVLESQTVQKSTHDQSSRWRVLDVNDHVMVKNGRNKLPAWVPGTIVEQLGEVTFMVKFPDGTTRKCHINQLRKLGTPSTEEEPTSIDHPSHALEDVSNSIEESPVTGEIIPPIMPDLPEESPPLSDSESVSEDSDDPDLVIPLTGTPAPVPAESPRASGCLLEQQPTSNDKSSGVSITSTRYPSRNCKPPDRYV